MQRQHLTNKKNQKTCWTILVNALVKITPYALMLFMSPEIFKSANAKELYTTEITHFRPGNRVITVSPDATVKAYPGCRLFVSEEGLEYRTDNQIEIEQSNCAPWRMPAEEEYLGAIMQGGTLREHHFDDDRSETIHRYDFNGNPNVVVETITTSKETEVKEKVPYKSDSITQLRFGNDRQHLAKPHENVQPARNCKLAVTGNALDNKTSEGILVKQKYCGDDKVKPTYSGTLFQKNKITEYEEFKSNGFATSREYDLNQKGSDVVQSNLHYYRI